MPDQTISPKLAGMLIDASDRKNERIAELEAELLAERTAKCKAERERDEAAQLSHFYRNEAERLGWRAKEKG